LARNLKHHPGFELDALEVEFEPLPVGKPDGWLDVKFDSTQFQKKVPQSEFACKSYDRFIKPRPSYGSERRNMTQNRNRVRQNLLFVTARLIQWMERLKQGVTMNLGLAK
jgi:hypothetical protein